MEASAEADVVIGADGIRSVVQREIGLQSRPTSEGIMAYRGLIPAERLSWASDLKDPALWLGSGRSFLLYPVARGRLINMVAFVPTDTDSEESWSGRPEGPGGRICRLGQARPRHHQLARRNVSLGHL